MFGGALQVGDFLALQTRVAVAEPAQEERLVTGDRARQKVGFFSARAMGFLLFWKRRYAKRTCRISGVRNGKRRDHAMRSGRSKEEILAKMDGRLLVSITANISRKFAFCQAR